MSVNNTDQNTRIKINNLTPKTNLIDSDLFIVEDIENTKKVTLRNFILSVISDGDAPANYRLYSSEKVNALVSKLENDFTKILDEYGRDISALELNSVTSSYLNTVVTNLNADIQSRVIETTFVNTLKGYRSNTTKIVSTDLDTSTDERKIKIENLSEEVLSAMTGNTPVSVPKTPAGGWTTESIADNAITNKKLGEEYSFRTYIVDGDVDDLIDTGMYLISDRVINVPEDMPPGDRIVTVVRGNENVTQIVEEALDSEYSIVYKRKSTIDSLRFAKFKAVYEVRDDSKINRPLLEKDYGNGGLVSNISVYSLLDDGHYLSDGTVSETPIPGEPCQIRVDNYGSAISYTVTYIDGSTCEVFEGQLSYNTMMVPTMTPWFKTNSFISSIFSGKKIALFGDGILYGKGADDYPTQSIPALMTNNFNLRVSNYCLEEAPAGSYNDPTLLTKCVITQIDNSDISTVDYVLVMVGSEDWVNGELIGNDYNETDTTYKGSLNIIVKKIYEQNAKAKIIFCTSIFRSRIRLGDNRNSDDYTVNEIYLSSFVDAMKDIAYKYHIPVVDMFSLSGISKMNYRDYLTTDGLYLSTYGQSVFTSKLVHCMESMF